MDFAAPYRNTASSSVSALAAASAAPPTMDASVVPAMPMGVTASCLPKDRGVADDEDEQGIFMSSAPDLAQRSGADHTARRSSAAKSRWRFKKRAFYKGFGCSSPPPGICNTGEMEKVDIWEDDFWFPENESQNFLCKTPTFSRSVE